MLDYIVYGEFDINEGSVIKVEYPTSIGINETILASYLIPEGTHNLMTDYFNFIINRKLNSEEILVSSLKYQLEKLNFNSMHFLDLLNASVYNKTIEGKTFKLKEIYNYNNSSTKWETSNLGCNGNDSNLFLKICEDNKQKYFNLFIFNVKSQDIIFKIPIHKDIQFKKLYNSFASVYTINSQAVGLEFQNENDLDLLEKLFENENIDLITNRKDNLSSSIEFFSDYNSIINSEKEIYFICHPETKLDKSTKRGAILKSVALGSTKLINLVVFKPVAKFLLEEIFKIHTFNISNEEKLNLIKKSIEICFNVVNNIPSRLFGVGMSHYEREIICFMKNSNYFNLSNESCYEVNIGNIKIQLEIDIPNCEEKLFPGNIIEFILTFKEGTMIIFDAVLSDKKILFIGDSSTSCEKLTNFIFSIVSMFSAHCFGVIKRIHPYKNLYDMDFLKNSNVIYGATNPIFKNKTDSWDVMCEIDSGKVTTTENYKKYLSTINRDSDLFFIRELIYKIKYEFINEYEVEKYFKMYISHLIRITGENYFTDDDELKYDINKQYKRKLKFQLSSYWNIYCHYDLILEFINFNGRSLKLIQTHISSLDLRKNIDKEEYLLIYNDIDKFLEGGEFYINLFLGTLLIFTVDYEFIFYGIFSKYFEIYRKVYSIYKKINNCQIGNNLLKRLNNMLILKLNENEMNQSEN